MSLLDFALIVPAVLISAFLWRVRGGYLGLPSSTLGRLVPAAFLAGVAYWYSGQNYWMALVLPLMWLGTIPPWAHNMQVRTSDELWDMTGRGLILTLPVGVFLYVAGYEITFMLSGASFGIIYWLSKRFLSKPRLGGLIDGFTAFGELFTGALLASALIATLVL